VRSEMRCKLTAQATSACPSPPQPGCRSSTLGPRNLHDDVSLVHQSSSLSSPDRNGTIEGRWSSVDRGRELTCRAHIAEHRALPDLRIDRFDEGGHDEVVL